MEVYLGGKINLNEIFPLTAGIACDGTKTCEAIVVLNAVLGGEADWQFHHEDDSHVETDTVSTTVTVGSSSEIVASFPLGKEDSEVVDLHDLDIHLKRGDTLTLALRTTGGTTDGTGSIVWRLD